MSPCRQNMAAKNRYGRQIWTNLFSDQSNDVMQMKHNYYRRRIIKKLIFFFFLSQLFLGTRNSFQSSSLNGWRQWGRAKPHPPPRGLITPFRLAPLRPRRGRFQWQNPFIFFFLINRTDGAVRPIKGRPRAPKAPTLPRRGRRGRGRGLLNSADHLIPSFRGRRLSCGEQIRPFIAYLVKSLKIYSDTGI